MTTSSRFLVLCSLATAALALSACGNGDHANQVPAPAAATTAAAAPAPASSAAAADTAVPAETPAPSGTSAPAAAASSPAMPTSTAAAASAAPFEESFAVARVTVGDRTDAAQKVVAAADTIPADRKAIYASVETRGKTDGVTLGARWSYLEGKGQLVSAISQSIATDGPAVTTFKIQNPHDWPAGKYKVDISLDGKPVSSQSFEVKLPAEPTGPAA